MPPSALPPDMSKDIVQNPYKNSECRELAAGTFLPLQALPLQALTSLTLERRADVVVLEIDRKSVV